MTSLCRASSFIFLVLFSLIGQRCAQIVCNFTVTTWNFSLNESLSTCNVTNICCSNYDQHENVTAISFASNQKISYIPNEIFLTLPNLRIFDASKNAIGEIIKENFVKLKHLEVIDLSYNLIEKIPQHIFDDSLALRTIHLGEIDFICVIYSHSKCVI